MDLANSSSQLKMLSWKENNILVLMSMTIHVAYDLVPTIILNIYNLFIRVFYNYIFVLYLLTLF